MNEFERIEEYLKGTMSNEERLRFDADMAASEELASAFNIYKTIESEMGQNEKYIDNDDSLKKTLGELSKRYFRKNDNEEMPAGQTMAQPILNPSQSPVVNIQTTETFQNKTERKAIPMMRWLAAAAIMVAVCLGVVFYINNAGKQPKLATTNKSADNINNNIIDTLPAKKEPVPTEVVKENKTIASVENKITKARQAALFAKHFKPDAAPADKDGPLENALVKYENKQYKDAIAAIDNAKPEEVTRGDESEKKLTNFYSHYYKGLCFMADRDAARAIPELQGAMQTSPTHLLANKAKWYLALANTKEGNISKAKLLLKQIADRPGESAYRKQAEALLKELQN